MRSEQHALLLVVRIVRCHQAHARPDVRVRALGNKLKGQSVAGGGDTVGAAVINSVDCAVDGAGHAIGAEHQVPCLACVAVCSQASEVGAAPVSVERGLAERLGDIFAGLPRVEWVDRCVYRGPKTMAVLEVCHSIRPVRRDFAPSPWSSKSILMLPIHKSPG